jgi:8-oxo-dGTP diphosphatase/2-hydroxy-dATP diphosphatase
MKKRGFGAGRWNGFGGKVVEGETVEDGARRELLEEAGVVAEDLKEVGIIDFMFENDPKILEVHFFKASKISGKPKETEEMKPKWFHIDKIPFENMWTDDKFWMPFLLSDKNFKGRFLFDRPSDTEYQSKIIEQEIKEVKKI